MHHDGDAGVGVVVVDCPGAIDRLGEGSLAVSCGDGVGAMFSILCYYSHAGVDNIGDHLVLLIIFTKLLFLSLFLI